ncbi:MAG: NADPH:quinone reductase-like Zn-dependent oxidoreductase [Cryomorphaceae bacterium]|jgi:NADPH:quinone reductase-like Zn-dependent oxidoreductase
MKACIYKKFGKESVLEWVDDWPTPVCDADSLLIEVAASSINPKDGFLRRGKFSSTLARDPLPRLTGLDLSGTVIEVGANVSHFRLGDAVIGMTNNFSGGVLGHYAVLKESEAGKAPTSIPLYAAASIPLAAQTAFQALRNICAVTQGSKVLITGASGGVGHFAIQIAKQLGAHVHGVCGSDNIDFVASIGADKVFDYKTRNLLELDEHYDAIFDSAGRYQRSDFSQQLRKSGVFVSTVPTGKSLFMEFAARLGISNKERLVAVHSLRSDLEQLAQWVDEKKIVPHIQKVYYPIEIGAAHLQIQSGHTRGKIVISLNSS